jgi:hypothetical protein
LIIDLHTHTYPRSDDSLLSPDLLVEWAKGVGLDGICITDHDAFWQPQELLDLSRRHNFLVLPGCEVTTEEGHLLVFGLQRYIFGMHRAAFVRRLVDEAGGAIVLAHPYRRRFREEEAGNPEAFGSMVERACKESLLLMADAIEVLNGRGRDGENAFSLELSERLGVRGTGSSDAHRPEELGTYATELQRRVGSLEELIEELKAGRFRPVVLR